MAQVLPLWHNLKTYIRAAVGWIANTATFGNFVRLGSIGLVGLIIWLIVQDLTRDVVTIQPISVPARLAENGYTPEVVYCGYTPGYYGTIVSIDDVVVYGTGWYYPPNIGALWIGWPWTYGCGFGFGWWPWWGWCFDFGIGYDFPFWGPWWGPFWWGSGFHHWWRGWFCRF